MITAYPPTKKELKKIYKTMNRNLLVQMINTNLNYIGIVNQVNYNKWKKKFLIQELIRLNQLLPNPTWKPIQEVTNLTWKFNQSTI